MKNNLCIIPARGGSKRIPRKNIKDFLGKPIIAYSIEVALDSGLFSEVMVSTDDEEIAEVAKKYGAKVPFMRTEKTADDFATTYDVVEEALLNYKEQNKRFENACCIYPCAPFVSVKKLNEARVLLGRFDMVMPVTSFGFPIQRALKVEEENTISFFHPEHESSRSQDLEKAYHDVGQFYWFNTEKVLKMKKLMLEKSGAIIIDELEAQDIDNLVDWKLAELKYKLLHGIS